MNSKSLKINSLLTTILFFVLVSAHAQVKIGSAGTPNANAVLELDGGTNKGLLLPKLSNTQIVALTTAPDGLVIYNTTDGFVYVRKNSVWQKISDATNGGGAGFSLPYSGTASTVGGAEFSIAHTTTFGDAVYFTNTVGSALTTGAGNNKLNMTNGNTGIGIPAGISDNPTLGKLVVRGTVGAVSAMFGDNTSGVSVMNNFPSIGFNYYCNGSSKAISTGFGSAFGQDPSTGRIYLSSSAASVTGAGTAMTLIDRLTILANGNIGINTSAPVFPLDVNGRMRVRSSGSNNSAGIWFDKIYTANAQSNFIGTFNDSTFGIFGGGNWKFFFDHLNNNFGIDNSNPKSPLSFSNAAGNKLDIYYGSDNNRYGIGLQAGLMQLYSGTASDDIAFGYGSSTAFTERMRVKGNGNVGIGIDPTEKMEIRTNGAQIGWKHSWSSGSLVSMAGSVLSAAAIKATGSDIQFTTGTNIGVYVKAAGNVGVGVTNAQRQLDVAGRMRMRGVLNDANNTAGIYLDGITSSERSFIGTLNDNTMGIYGAGSGWSFLMDVNDGALMIGTTQKAAGYKVNVGGKVIAEEVRVQLRAAWPDYVFEKEYKKLSLEDLEKYVIENKHLPNIPSAADIEKDGQQLGEVQRKMLEKIEELSLYIIELKKEVDMLKKDKN